VRAPRLAQLPPAPASKTGWPWTEATPALPRKSSKGKAWPRVSIVTPSYNQARFLEETIRSVLLQGYPDLEYIVIDGGSTDGSVDVIRKYEPWLAHWVSESDRGQTHAVNKGWARATGEILAYINADDSYRSGTIGIAASAFCANPHSGMVYGAATIVDEAGSELRSWEATPFDLRTMLAVGNVVPQPSVFFSADALKDVGYLSEDWQMIMDYELCIRLGMQYPATCIPKTLTRFRSHPESKTRLRFEALAEELTRFITAFEPDHMSAQAWRRLEREAMSRVHYELGLAYVTHGQQQRAKAFQQLAKSIFLYPPLALRRPRLTAHVIRRMLVPQLRRHSEVVKHEERTA
jgi:glycosyltransferase involved in cell wall biosynthesis